MLENITYNNHPCPQSESYWIPGYIPCIIYYISHNFFLQVEFVLVVSPMHAWLFHERGGQKCHQSHDNWTLCMHRTWIVCTNSYMNHSTSALFIRILALFSGLCLRFFITLWYAWWSIPVLMCICKNWSRARKAGERGYRIFRCG